MGGYHKWRNKKGLSVVHDTGFWLTYSKEFANKVVIDNI